MYDAWLTTSWTALLLVLLSALAIYVSLVLLTRLAGLRSFSKLSSFDFAITVAIGTVIASTMLTQNPPLLQAVFVLTVLYGIQMSVAYLRQRYDWMGRLVDNKPLLLMDGPELIHENLRRAQVTEADIRAKLRQANVTDMNQVLGRTAGNAVEVQECIELMAGLRRAVREKRLADYVAEVKEGWERGAAEEGAEPSRAS